MGLVIGGMLGGSISGYAVVGAKYILKPRPLWNKIVEEGLDHKIYELEIKLGEVCHNPWKGNLRQAIMYGWVFSWDKEWGGTGAPEFATSKDLLEATLITTYILSEKEKQILKEKGVKNISDTENEKEYIITLLTDDSLIDILKLEFIEILEGVPLPGGLFGQTMPPPYIILQSLSHNISDSLGK